MKFYVYTDAEIERAITGVTDYLDSIDEPYDLDGLCEGDISYRWFNLTLPNLHNFILTYPSGALWNRKVYELLHQSFFPTIDPLEADYFLVPLTILYGDPIDTIESRNKYDAKVISNLCYNLPYWQYNKDRHVFFVIGDSYEEVDTLNECKVFRSSCHKEGRDEAMYYDVIIDTSHIEPINKASISCAFVGCLETHPLRKDLPFAVDNVPGRTVIESTPNFFAFLPKYTQEKMQSRWVDVLNDSEFILAPRGCGLTSIRFFEAMAFGRIPVLIADDTKLPLEDIVDYDKFIVRVPEAKLMDLALFIEEFRKTHDLTKASEEARSVWNRYFQGGKFRNFLEACLPRRETKRHKTMI